MEKVDASALMSNLLVFSAVLVVAFAVIMGDHLVLIASNVLDEGTSLLIEISTSLQSILG